MEWLKCRPIVWLPRAIKAVMRLEFSRREVAEPAAMV